ncbi:MAG: hypothetical protein V7K27_35420 [Nostoc sp.]|uniref:hypothetical protein n=1 Tax=Nostoc sp. TaxID=1180 RepID=UPI002FF461F6
MFINNEWEFLLRGSPQTLWDLSQKIGSNYFHIYEVPDFWNDCSVNDYRLKSIYCNDENDYKIVWQIGYELISLFNGARSLFDSSYWKVEIEQLWNNGLRQDYYENPDCFGLLGKPDISEEAVAHELQKAKSDIRLVLLNKATEDEGIYLIFKYFNMENNWVTYYKILESIEYLSKKEEITLSIDSEARKRFTNVANNYSLSGIHSRHGFKENLKENRTSAMKLNEAHDFIRDVAKQYIKTKI